jgi:hypothetical protein
MDFSQYIKNIQSAAIWTNYQATILQKQPGYNSTCCSTITTGTYNYITYEQKDLVAQGKVACSTCSFYINTSHNGGNF